MVVSCGQRCWLIWLITCTAIASRARADDTVATKLTRERVVELARTRAPATRVAVTRLAESRGRVVGARVLLPENPVVEVMSGPRWATTRSADAEVTLAVPVPLGGRRDKRIAVAEASVDRDAELARDAQRVTVGAALAAYYRILFAQQRLELAHARKTLADDLVKTATERRKAGDVAQLEVNLATAEVSRAESELLSVEAALSRARGELAITLGFTSGDAITVEGKLDDRSVYDALFANDPHRERCDVLAARAELKGASSDIALADALRWPELSLRLGYKREDEGANIALAGFALSLPFFERGQGLRAEARARRDRAAVELEAKQATVAVEVETARAAYRAAVDAVQKLADKGLPLAIQNEDMARESYRAGKLDLSTLLVVRREALDTRREHLERLLEAALAGVDLALAEGGLP